MTKYTVLFSLYEKEKPEYLIEAIDSMLNQTAKPDEIIIVEDGLLNDKLYSVISDYKSKYPGIFTIVSNSVNLGLGLSLNKGLHISRNEIIARMDTDDISKPDRCKKQLKILNAHPEISIVGSWVDEFTGDTKSIISTRKVPENINEIYKFAKRRSAFNHPSVMYRRSKVLENGGYLDMRRNQDVDLFGRMLFSGLSGYNIQESLVFFRTSNDLSKRRKSWINTISYIKTIKKFHKMGYSSLWDYIIVSFSQVVMFVLPISVQNYIYKKLLRR